MSSQPGSTQSLPTPQPASSRLPQAKTLGGIGSILVLLTFIPSIGIALGIVGAVLILVALKYIADEVGDRRIINNALISIIISIIGVALAILLMGVFAVYSIGTYYSITINGHTVMSLASREPLGLFRFILSIIWVLVAVWIAQIISAIFLRRSYNLVSGYLGVGLFSTAALLYLIGAALLIVLVGLIIILIADIIQIVAFFSIPDKLPQNIKGPNP